MSNEQPPPAEDFGSTAGLGLPAVALCSHCGFPLPNSDSGLRHYGTRTAHQEADCLRLLHAEIEKLRAAPVVGYMVHSKADVTNAALYSLGEREHAFAAVRRWNASITAVVCAPRGPELGPNVGAKLETTAAPK